MVESVKFWKRGVVVAMGTAVFALGLSTASAELTLPRLSPKAGVMQHVGVTKVKVSYFSPAKRGRKIWGGLLPYNKLWRTGANGATRISFTHDAVVGGVKVKAGTYAIFTKPGKKSWSVMLNTNYKQGGTRGYKEKNNVAVFQVKPVKGPDRERMTFVFANTTDNTTELHLEWAGVRVVLPLQFNTRVNALANIAKTLNNGWRPYFQAARYLLEAGDLDAAMQHIDTSIAIETTWWNTWVKSQILAKMGQVKEAIQHAKEAQKTGAKDYVFKRFFAKRVAKALKEWKASNAAKPTTRPAGQK